MNKYSLDEWGEDPKSIEGRELYIPPGVETEPTILIADENPLDPYFFLRALRTVRRHCQIHVVSDREQAISYLSGKPPFNDRKRFPMPELVLLGCKTPKLDAYGVLGWIKTQPALDGLQVVVFSDSTLEKEPSRAKQLGAKDYRTRPNTPWALARTVRELTSKWLS